MQDMKELFLKILENSLTQALELQEARQKSDMIIDLVCLSSVSVIISNSCNSENMRRLEITFQPSSYIDLKNSQKLHSFKKLFL